MLRATVAEWRAARDGVRRAWDTLPADDDLGGDCPPSTIGRYELCIALRKCAEVDARCCGMEKLCDDVEAVFERARVHAATHEECGHGRESPCPECHLSQMKLRMSGRQVERVCDKLQRYITQINGQR